MQTTIGLKLTTLTPFNYGHLMISGGVATIPDLINDKVVMFSLANSMGYLSPCLLPFKQDYKRHIKKMPWRSTLFTTDTPRLLRPIARRSDLGIEGGYQNNIRRAAGSGNFKEYFKIQEVPQGQVFTGAIVTSVDPFREVNADVITVRIGSNRTGIAQLEKFDVPSVRINTSTAKLFGREVGFEHRILDQIAVSTELGLEVAAEEMSQWY